jgi:hypothetical protein
VTWLTSDAPPGAARPGAAKAGIAAGALELAVSVRVDGGGAQARRAAQRLERGLAARLGGRGGLGRTSPLLQGDGVAAAQAGFDAWLVIRIHGDGARVVADVTAVHLGRDVWAIVRSGDLGQLRRRERVNLADAAQLTALGWPVAPHELGRPKRFELDLGVPLLALAGADLDGDGSAELVALTGDDVVVLERKRGQLSVRARTALTAPPPVPRPREPIGVLVTLDRDGDGRDELVAQTSSHAGGITFSWNGRELVASGAPTDAAAPWVLCAVDGGAETFLWGAPLGRGVARFQGDKLGRGPGPAPGPAAVGPGPATAGSGAMTVPTQLVALVCAESPTAGGAPWFALAGEDGAVVLSGGAPVLAPAAARAEPLASGAALALVDVDGDRRPELLTSAFRAAGDGDVPIIWRLADDGTRSELGRGEATSGGLVAITAADVDGDGLAEPIAAARLPGSSRNDVWIWP